MYWCHILVQIHHKRCPHTWNGADHGAWRPIVGHCTPCPTLFLSFTSLVSHYITNDGVSIGWAHDVFCPIATSEYGDCLVKCGVQTVPCALPLWGHGVFNGVQMVHLGPSTLWHGACVVPRGEHTFKNCDIHYVGLDVQVVFMMYFQLLPPHCIHTLWGIGC
jgi:hypothetical protein